MHAFLIGLIFLIAVCFLSIIGFLLFPLIIISGFFLTIIAYLAFVILCIWLLGKFIIFAWEKIFPKKTDLNLPNKEAKMKIALLILIGILIFLLGVVTSRIWIINHSLYSQQNFLMDN